MVNIRKSTRKAILFIDKSGFILKTIRAFKAYVLKKIKKRKAKKYALQNAKLVKKIKKKKQLRIAFFVQNSSQWKYELLFKKLKKQTEFTCFIVAIPNFSKNSWVEDFEDVCEMFSHTNYDLIRGFCFDKNEVIKSTKINADLIFYSQAREYPDPFAIEKFNNSISAYVPYTIFCNNDPLYSYNKTFHNLLWAHFVPTKSHLKNSCDFSEINGKNSLNLGYPGCDNYHPRYLKHLKKQNVWKDENSNSIKIIWAPHHTISNFGDDVGHAGDHSTFLNYSLFMKELTLKFKNHVQIAFKPHPNLKDKLYQHIEWGMERTDEYFEFWHTNSNSILSEGEYEHLFAQSDALIHDSVSFMAEYIFLKKPVLYLIKNKTYLPKTLNKFGLLALKLHQQAQSQKEILTFVEKLIESNSDKKRKQKELFLKEYFSFSNDITASDRIISFLNDNLR